MYVVGLITFSINIGQYAHILFANLRITDISEEGKINKTCCWSLPDEKKKPKIPFRTYDILYGPRSALTYSKKKYVDA
jgi:hypothetical protein